MLTFKEDREQNQAIQSLLGTLVFEVEKDTPDFEVIDVQIEHLNNWLVYSKEQIYKGQPCNVLHYIEEIADTLALYISDDRFNIIYETYEEDSVNCSNSNKQQSLFEDVSIRESFEITRQYLIIMSDILEALPTVLDDDIRVFTFEAFDVFMYFQDRYFQEESLDCLLGGGATTEHFLNTNNPHPPEQEM